MFQETYQARKVLETLAWMFYLLSTMHARECGAISPRPLECGGIGETIVSLTIIYLPAIEDTANGEFPFTGPSTKSLLM